MKPSTLLSIFQYLSHRLLATAYLLFTQESKTSSAAEAWNKHMMAVLSAGHAYAEYTILHSFQRWVFKIDASQPNLSLPLSHLCAIFALTTIVSPVSSFYAVPFTEDGLLTLSQLIHRRSYINDVLTSLLPDMVVLADAWDFTDASLCSALGCKDGNVYERLMSWTRQLPVNNGTIVADSWGGPDGIGAFLKR